MSVNDVEIKTVQGISSPRAGGDFLRVLYVTAAATEAALLTKSVLHSLLYLSHFE